MTTSSRPTRRSTRAIPADRCSILPARWSASTPPSIRRRAARSASASRCRRATVKGVVDQLLQYGETRRGWLGVRIQSVTDDLAEGLDLGKARGALVAEVTPTGPAEKAGIKARDVIVEFNGKADHAT